MPEDRKCSFFVLERFYGGCDDFHSILCRAIEVAANVSVLIDEHKAGAVNDRRCLVATNAIDREMEAVLRDLVDCFDGAGEEEPLLRIRFVTRRVCCECI